MVDTILQSFETWTDAQGLKAKGRVKSVDNISLEGISKLRELILDLSIRGKLVPQNTDDEPANKLLEKIEIEKNKLKEQGVIKNQKKYSPVSKADVHFELPNGWKWVRVGMVGYDWGQKTPDTEFSYIEVSGIDNNKGKIESTTVLAANKAPSRARKIVKKGTVIYSTVRPYLQNICEIDRDIEPEPIASTAFAIVHPFQDMPGAYFVNYFRSPTFINYVEDIQTGIAYPAINDRQFFNGMIPLPPLEEQKRIVAKVDELMALCDKLEDEQTNNLKTHELLVKTLLETLTQAKDANELQIAWGRLETHFDTLFCTEDSIEQLKQTILQLAVMGKLVKQDPADEPASTLLKKIAADKAKLIKEGKIKKQKPLPEITDGEKPFSLPESWAWVPWGQILAYDDAAFKRGPFGSSLKKDMFVEKGYKIYEQYCPINDDCSYERYYITPEKFKELEGFAVQADDYLVSCSGVTLGRITQVPPVFKEGIINQALLRVRVNHKFIDKDFFRLLFRSPYFQIMIFANSTGSAIPNVKGVKELKVMPVPFLPLKEQRRIVDRLNLLFEICDTLNNRIISAQKIKGILSKTIVEKASR